MSTLPQIASTLRNALNRQSMTQAQLQKSAGVSQRTLTNVLSGREDFRLSTLLAVADRLGLELLLVPKGAAAAVDAGDAAPLHVPTRVTAALDRLRDQPERE